MTSVIRIAIIGLGHIGRLHIEALSRVDGLELVAACDRNPAFSSLASPGITFYSDHHALLMAGGFDTAVVATPNRTHNAIAHDVLDAGYHVIVEKPSAGSLSELEQLESLARQHGRHIYYAFHAVYAYEVSWLVSHLREQESLYGPLTGFVSRFYDPYIDFEDRLVEHALSLDDCWSDSGVNALSVLDALQPVDRLRVAACRRSGVKENVVGVRSVSVQFYFPVQTGDSSGVGVIETAWDQGVNFKSTELFFATTGWRLVANHTTQSVTAYSSKGEEEILVYFSGERLLNHYLGLFSDYVSRYPKGAMNAEASWRIHERLFAVMEL